VSNEGTCILLAFTVLGRACCLVSVGFIPGVQGYEGMVSGQAKHTWLRGDRRLCKGGGGGGSFPKGTVLLSSIVAGWFMFPCCVGMRQLMSRFDPVQLLVFPHTPPLVDWRPYLVLYIPDPASLSLSGGAMMSLLVVRWELDGWPNDADVAPYIQGDLSLSRGCASFMSSPSFSQNLCLGTLLLALGALSGLVPPWRRHGLSSAPRRRDG